MPAHATPSRSFSSEGNAEACFAESVDYVMCTHLYVDHCGWNTRWLDGRWVPTFPNAKYVSSKTEYEHWRGLAGKESVNASVCQGGVLPVIESGQAEIVDGEGAVGDRLNLHESDVRGIEVGSRRLRLENRHQTKRGVR
jgi:hypothetical protein